MLSLNPVCLLFQYDIDLYMCKNGACFVTCSDQYCRLFLHRIATGLILYKKVLGLKGIGSFYRTKYWMRCCSVFSNLGIFYLNFEEVTCTRSN